MAAVAAWRRRQHGGGGSGSTHLRRPRLIDHPKVVTRLALCERGGGNELIEDVVRALLLGVGVGNAGLLEKEGVNLRRDDRMALRKLEGDILAEARRVVVALGLGVAKRLEQRVRLHDARREAARRVLARLC